MIRVLIVTPAPQGSTKGNRITAERWAEFLQQLGHEVRIVAEANVAGTTVFPDFDCLITLHATRSLDVITAFQKQCPGRPIILCMTGTDLHLDLNGLRGQEARIRASAAVKQSDRLVLLEPEGIRQLSKEAQAKAIVILQSASPAHARPTFLPNVFEVCVVGHLRDEKDPFLAARASRCLPEHSKIKISHIGAALSSQMERLAVDEMKSNPRYEWLGPMAHRDAQYRIARSRLMILSSKIEGAPSAISEAIVIRTPILSTKIPATLGLLGADYPGMYPIGDFEALSRLMLRAEREQGFYENLSLAIERLAPKFAPELEFRALQRMLSS